MFKRMGSLPPPITRPETYKKTLHFYKHVGWIQYCHKLHFKLDLHFFGIFFQCLNSQDRKFNSSHSFALCNTMADIFQLAHLITRPIYNIIHRPHYSTYVDSQNFDNINQCINTCHKWSKHLKKSIWTKLHQYNGAKIIILIFTPLNHFMFLFDFLLLFQQYQGGINVPFQLWS